MPDDLQPLADNAALRWQEVAPGEFAPERYMREAWSAAIGMGRAYLIGTGQLSLGLAGAVTALVENPAASGRLVTIMGVSVYVSATGWADIRRDPTGGLPTTVRDNVLRMNTAAGEAPSTVLKAEAGAGEQTGGTLGPTIGLDGGARTEIRPLGIVLLPGQTLGLSASFGAAAEFAGTVYVTEEPV